jgi:STE24 endopeptidase
VHIPDAARPGLGFDVEKATDAYLALLTPAQRDRSDRYFQGRYWVDFWDTVYTVGLCLLVLWLGWSTTMRDRAARVTQRPFLQALLASMMFLVVFWLLSLPWSWYVDYVREHKYGLSNQTLGGWFGDELKTVFLLLVLAAPITAAILTQLRRRPEGWVARAIVSTFVIFLLIIMIVPVFIAPMFNTYQPLPPGQLRDSIVCRRTTSCGRMSRSRRRGSARTCRACSAPRASV